MSTNEKMKETLTTVQEYNNQETNQIQVFSNDEFGSVRTVTINDEVWFVGKDVATALGYSNTAKAIITHVDEEDKLIFQTSQNGNSKINNRGIYIINESGLYSLILSSKLPTAKKFKHWVTSEVLPSIRKHDVYMTPEALEKAFYNPEFLIRVANVIKEEREKNQGKYVLEIKSGFSALVWKQKSSCSLLILIAVYSSLKSALPHALTFQSSAQAFCPALQTKKVLILLCRCLSYQLHQVPKVFLTKLKTTFMTLLP